MNNYRFTLEKYTSSKCLYICPSCGQKQFKRYIDSETNQYINDNVGRCNREDSCGYHYTPQSYFQNNNIKIKDVINTIPTTQIQIKEPSFIDKAIFKESLSNYENNNFVLFLINKFGTETTKNVVKRYCIGTSDHWTNSTIFWQIDSSGHIRTGKIMKYDIERGKRIKEPFNYIQWVHKTIVQHEYNLSQCFFGEHLLNKEPTKPIAIVESEKTAIIASVYFPQSIWIATGGLNNLNTNKCKVLKNRQVKLFPDKDCYNKWDKKAREIGLTCTISELLEKNVTPAGYDLADLLLTKDIKDFQKKVNTTEVPAQVKPPLHLSIQNKIDTTELVSFNNKRQCCSISNIDKWDSEIIELEAYFRDVKNLPKSLLLNPYTMINDVPMFVKSHLKTIKETNGNYYFKAFLIRLQQLKDLLIIMN